MIDAPMTGRRITRLPENLPELAHVDGLKVVPVQVLEAEELGRGELLLCVEQVRVAGVMAHSAVHDGGQHVCQVGIEGDL